MDYALLTVIFFQFGYILYKDWLYFKERKDLELKLMSKDVREYKEMVQEKVKDSPEEKPSPYIPIEEASIEDILNAEDRS